MFVSRIIIDLGQLEKVERNATLVQLGEILALLLYMLVEAIGY